MLSFSRLDSTVIDLIAILYVKDSEVKILIRCHHNNYRKRNSNNLWLESLEFSFVN